MARATTADPITINLHPPSRSLEESLMKVSPRRWLAGFAAAAVVAVGTVAAGALPADAAIANVRVVEFIFNAPNHATTLGPVSCNSGERVLGGGALVMTLDTDVRLIESFALSDTTWRVAVHNESGSTQEIHARALCATGVTGYERKWARGFTLPPNSVKDLTANCPAGKTSIAGGFQIRANEADRDELKASASFATGNGWRAKIRNDSNATYNGDVQAICTSLTGRTISSITVTVNPGATAVVSSNCSSNRLTGGGWITNQNIPHNIVTAALPGQAPDIHWKINVHNTDSVAHTVQYWHVCMPST
jgi:hypothetical protein